MGSDMDKVIILDDYRKLQSTLPLWEATKGYKITNIEYMTSIHASTMGSDYGNNL